MIGVGYEMNKEAVLFKKRLIKLFTGVSVCSIILVLTALLIKLDVAQSKPPVIKTVPVEVIKLVENPIVRTITVEKKVIVEKKVYIKSKPRVIIKHRVVRRKVLVSSPTKFVPPAPQVRSVGKCSLGYVNSSVVYCFKSGVLTK